jgi:sugar lactone lactonase YvrE
VRATEGIAVLALAIAVACTGADYRLGALTGASGSGSGDAAEDEGTASASTSDGEVSGTDGAPFVDPLDGAGPVKVWVDTGIGGAVGGLWSDQLTALLVADGDANAVLRVTLAAVREELAPAGDPRGLAFDGDGTLLVAEGESGRLVRFDGEGVDVVAQALGSPESVVVAASGHRYVTDPMAGTVHRIDPDGASHRDVDDLPAAGGAALDPSGSTLYVVRSGTGQLASIAIAPDGSLGAHALFAEADASLSSVCVDEHGNVLAVGEAGIDAFRPDGAQWGTLPTPAPIADCSFGRNGTQDVLFLVAATAVYIVSLRVTGAP